MMIAHENPNGTPASTGAIQCIDGLLVLRDSAMRETDVHGMTCSSAHVPDKPKEADGQEDASNRGQIQPSASDLSVIVNH